LKLKKRKLHKKAGNHYEYLADFDGYVKYYLKHVNHGKSETLYKFLKRKFKKGYWFNLHKEKWVKFRD
jgi:hypothetical protein